MGQWYTSDILLYKNFFDMLPNIFVRQLLLYTSLLSFINRDLLGLLPVCQSSSKYFIKKVAITYKTKNEIEIKHGLKTKHDEKVWQPFKNLTVML